MKKLLAALLALTLCLSLTAPALAADSPSSWAEAEIAEAIERGLVPEDLQSAYTSKITRAEFAQIALYYCAASQRLELNDFWHIYREKAEEFSGKTLSDEAPFSDVDNYYVNLAYNLGIVNGRGDGTFDPDNFITRQEAAVMLANAYRSMSGSATLEEGTTAFESTFSDSDTLASWALADAALMYQCGVMNGTAADTFDPLGSYTREQCYATFLRLLDFAPAERILLPYEEAVERTLSFNYMTPYYINTEFHCEAYSVYYGSLGGTPHGSVCSLWIIYRSGGRYNVLQQWDMLPTNSFYFTDYIFYDLAISDDESTLTFMRDFEFETYTYAVDLMTGKITELERQSLV